METKTTYCVGEETRLYLDALNTLQQFKNSFLHALMEVYGEEQGEKYYLSHTEQYEALENTIWDYMRIPMTQQMGGGFPQVEI